MNVFEMVAIITVISIIGGLVSNRQKQPKNHAPRDDAETEQMQQQILDLKKRVEALEAIVTDKSYNLKREIDDL